APSRHDALPILPSYLQLLLLAVQAGIAQAALNDTVDFVRPRSRVFGKEDRPLPKDDPQVQQIIGRLSGQVYAVETTVADSAGRLGKLIDKRSEERRVGKERRSR